MASLELQISITDLHLVYEIHLSECTIKPTSFSGCYSCISGAKLSYTCITSEGEALANVQCGEHRFSTKCTETGVVGASTFSFKTANVQETCTTSCPGGTTSFTLNGTLFFIDKRRLSNVSTIGVALPGSSDTTIGGAFDLSFLLNWFKNYWYVIILIIILIVVLVPVTVQLLSVGLPTFINFLTKKFSAAKQKLKTQWSKFKSKFSSNSIQNTSNNAAYHTLPAGMSPIKAKNT